MNVVIRYSVVILEISIRRCVFELDFGKILKSVHVTTSVSAYLLK
ncbi:hypothetical protein MtrunA17_Chr5g0414071 [Medicago truncatula]|uniref:Uncharacterized protein n=1 Tax=Medicago truncatula TaxID=3880 RepID=A0A396HUP9_MEDTR|nr:hypothetical protein MtrunA17_Chr5g0414071 [Medicago truncatula]